MIQVLLMILVAVAMLIYAAARWGVVGALPLFAFEMVFFPVRAKIPAGVDVTTQRALVCTLVILFLLKAPRVAGRRSVGLWTMDRIVVVQSLWFLLSAATSIMSLLSFKAVIAQGVECFCVYYVFSRSISSRKGIERILIGIVAGLGVCCLFGTVEAYTGWNVGQAWFPQAAGDFDIDPYLDLQRGVRIGSTYPHPILYGTALAGSIPIAYYLLSTVGTLWRKVLLCGTISAMLLNAFKTTSRGPWIMVGVSLGLLAIFSSSRRIRGNIAVTGIITGGVLLVRPGIWATIWNLWTSSFDTGTVAGMSASYRSVLWRTATDMLSRSPERWLLGYGRGTFFFLNLSALWPDGKTRPLLSCDSAWVELLMDTGWIGLTITIALLGTPLVKTLDQWLRASRRDRDLLLLLGVLMGTYYIEMTSVAIYSSWCQNVYMLWMVVSCAMVLSSLLDEERRNRRRDLSRRRDASLNLPAEPDEIMAHSNS
jgi:hypothetical protein